MYFLLPDCQNTRASGCNQIDPNFAFFPSILIPLVFSKRSHCTLLQYFYFTCYNAMLKPSSPCYILQCRVKVILSVLLASFLQRFCLSIFVSLYVSHLKQIGIRSFLSTCFLSHALGPFGNFHSPPTKHKLYTLTQVISPRWAFLRL